MIAILSDIHANLEALHAVLADIARYEVERIVCLGDTLGYGPNPVECLDTVRRVCDLALLGDHDQAVMFHPEGFSAPAERSVYWTRWQMEQTGGEIQWEYLSERPRSVQEGGNLYVHGSARNPLNEYVHSEDIYNQRKIQSIFALIPHVCFCGHSHVPGVITDSGIHYDIKTGSRDPVGESTYEWHQPEGDEWTFRLDSRLAIINVGSVGQPHDGDPRACYVLAESGLLRFRRVMYDVETTIRKIHAIPELENFLGDRLREGR